MSVVRLRKYFLPLYGWSQVSINTYCESVFRKSFTENTDNDACFKFNSADVLDYLGVIELGYIMYKRKLISLDDFWNQFGYRVEYLLENDAVVEHINHNFQYYDNMVDIIHVLHEKGKITKDLFEKIKPQTEK